MFNTDFIMNNDIKFILKWISWLDNGIWIKNYSFMCPNFPY
jgi:hypothetical protein